MFELFYPSPEDTPLIPAPTARTVNAERSTPSADYQEQLPVVEPSGIVTGRASRSYCHNGSKLLHPVVHIHIISREGEIYLQHRSHLKQIQPGKWDTAVGGHVSFGESLIEALYREAREELGLVDFNPIYLDTYVFESEVDRELVNVFALVGSSFVIKPDSQETDGGRFFSQKEIEEHLDDGTFTPNFSDEYLKYKDRLFALL